MPKTIKEVLEELGENYYPYHEFGDSRKDNNEESLAVALAEIRQLLEECEPATLPSGLSSSERNTIQRVVDNYTANIEKRLG